MELNYEKDLPVILEKMDYIEDEKQRMFTLSMVLGMLQFS